ncbi:hypothetical protein ACM55I_06245 [Flavobacterium sp. GB2R13]|uniref:hypothetical protein n=1 Tax=Flavobacterium algoris TaxID=3398733 RepID=UPI003A8BBC69
MKKLLFISILAGFALFFSACSTGYVSEEPSYIEVNRSPRPSSDYIWIDGGWVWRNNNRNYEQRNGYWTKQNNGRGHKKGHWKKSQRGYRWEESRR